MAYEFEAAAQLRLDGYFARIGGHLKDRRKRESFAMYAFGILGDGERKSAEPMAARAVGEPERVKNAHDKLIHVVAERVRTFPPSWRRPSPGRPLLAAA